jgi:hypothetical protein
MLVLSVAVLAIAGCALGGAGPAPGVPGFAKGVIAAKGSIFVNGVEYDTRSAAITMDGTGTHPDSDLKVGMVVDVKGTIDSATGKGTAAEVQYDANLEGPIDSGSIDPVAQSFTVFGQKVVADATTVYEGVSGFSGLAQGDRVEVSGTADSINHVIKAARIEKKSTAGDFEIKGVVSGLAAGTFTLTPRHASSGITVNFTGTLDPAIANGSFVEVKFAAFGNPLSTTAGQVKLLKELKASDRDRAEVEGVVSNFTSGGGSATFTVDGVSVGANSSLATGVSNGVKTEVKGTMSAGVLLAQSVRVERESNLLLRGTVSAVNAGAGTVTLNGVTLAVISTTVFRDRTSLAPASFGLANVTVGDYIGACGYTDSSLSPAVGVAARIERLAPLSQALLAGPVSAAATNGLTILGISVNTSGAAFRDSNGISVTQTAFLAMIATGTTLAGVIGTSSGATFTATIAQIGELEN